MSKSFFISINFIGVLLLSFFQKSPVEITQDPPSSLQPGEEAVITVNIDKSDVTGFAKYQITLDEGLTAEVIETAGASFTFNNQKAKFIWMALPADRKFAIKYRILASDGAVGNLKLDSRFSYIYQNERKNIDLPQRIITVGDAEDIVAEEIKESIEEKSKNIEASATALRTITPAGINQWKVDVVVAKENLIGFAKIQENIPQGYTAIDLKSSGAVFNSESDAVKYIWYDVPGNEQVTITYKLLPVIAQEGEMPEITGEFSFLQDEETVSVPILDSGEALEIVEVDTVDSEIPEPEEIEDEIVEEIPDTEEPSEMSEDVEIADIPDMEEPVEEDIAEPTPKKIATPEKTVVEKPRKEEDQLTAKSITDANIVDVPEPEEGIFYRVQIAAGPNNLQRPVFVKLYNFDERFGIENHKGLFKYTTGHHQVYKSARDDRERINKKYDKFQGPFVTAYNDGERITVQEALMVTNQKWYP